MYYQYTQLWSLHRSTQLPQYTFFWARRLFHNIGIDFCGSHPIIRIARFQITLSPDHVLQTCSSVSSRLHVYFVAKARQSVLNCFSSLFSVISALFLYFPTRLGVCFFLVSITVSISVFSPLQPLSPAMVFCVLARKIVLLRQLRIPLHCWGFGPKIWCRYYFFSVLLCGAASASTGTRSWNPRSTCCT